MKKLGLICLLAATNLLNASSDQHEAYADIKKIEKVVRNEINDLIASIRAMDDLNEDSTDPEKTKEKLNISRIEAIDDLMEGIVLLEAVRSLGVHVAESCQKAAEQNKAEEKEIKKGYKKGFFNKK